MDIRTMMDDDFVTNGHLVYQDNKSTMALVKSGDGKSQSKYMKVRQEYVTERLKTSELEIEYKQTKCMYADVLTKPLGGELFHNIAEAILDRHRFKTCKQHEVKNHGIHCLNNGGTEKKMPRQRDVDSVLPELELLSCSNQWISSQKHGKYAGHVTSECKKKHQRNE